MIIKNSVMLLKSQTSDNGSDKYYELLSSKGYAVKQVKTLVFNFKNIDVLKEKLKKVNDYEGIIFSSPRCVNAVSLALSDEKPLSLNWKSKHNFAVGEATFRDALEKLGLECEGKESGNAVNLSKVILQNKSVYTKPFLFPHGNLKTDTLNSELEKEMLTMEGVLVYDTIASPNIEEELRRITCEFNDISEYVVFFSPSGFHSSIEFLKKIPDFSNSKIIAIGPVTEVAIKEENFNIFGVTKHPTPQDLLKVISNN